MANYTAEIVSTSLAESKEKHTPSVRLQLKTINSLDTNEPCERQFITDLWLSDNAVERTVKTLRELGFQGDSMFELNFPDTMAGLMCEISTEMQEYNGQTSEKVRFVNKPGSYANRGLKAIGDDDAKRIASRFDAVLRTGKYHKPAQKTAAYGRAMAPNSGRVPPSAAEAMVADSGDDDLPF